MTIGEESSVWYNSVVRGDDSFISVGKRTNIQDGCILHVDPDTPLQIGDDVVVGHGAILHGCTIGNAALIGMGAIVLSGAVIGEGCIIGAGALVTGSQVIPDKMMALGSPCKVIRPVTEKEIQETKENAKEYAECAAKAKQHSDL